MKPSDIHRKREHPCQELASGKNPRCARVAATSGSIFMMLNPTPILLESRGLY